MLHGHHDDLGETEELVRAHGADCTRLVLDLAEPRAVAAGIDSLAGRHAIDILVNNAGIIRRAPATDMPLDDWDAVLRVNLESLFVLSQHVGRRMVARRTGKIINIASMLSFQGGINVVGYTAAKHAVAGVTRALANEWAAHGVQVNAIAPGYIATDNTTALREDGTRAGEILARIPASRWGSASDIGGAAVFLASPASDYVNGHVLAVDGGWLAR